MRNASLLPALILFVLPAAGAQQPESKPPEKGTIEGMVVKAATSEPLKKARLSLRKTEGRAQPTTAITGLDGRFLFKEVPPGRYRLDVERNGYVRQSYGQRGPGQPGTIITLQTGQQVRDIVFRLIPAAVITGRVYDEDGEPVPGVSVQALRYSYFRGKRELRPSEGTGTNDLGEYRLYGLAPGQYYISATYRPGFSVFGGGGSMTMTRVGETEVEEAYVPTYYPGTNDPARASPVEVRAGEEIRAIDFMLLPTRAVRIRGRVFNSVIGQPGRGANVSLVPRAGGVRFFGGPGVMVEDAEGKFELRGVTPGSYNLVARWFYEGEAYGAQMPIEVGSNDLEGITLVIGPGLEIAGRVRIEGYSPSASAPQSRAEGKSEGKFEVTELRVFFEAKEETSFFGSNLGWVKQDGSFTLKNVPPGSYQFRVAGAPLDFYLKAVRLGGRDVLDTGLDVGSQVSGALEVVMSGAGGQVEGTVLKDQQAFSGAQVVLVPEARRRNQTFLYKTTTTDQYGRFMLRGIAPGEYKLFAWEEVETGAYQDPDFLRLREDRGTPVRVAEGGQVSVQLDLIPSEKATF